MPAIPAIGGLTAGDLNLGSVGGATSVPGAATGSGSFGSALANQIGSLEKSQNVAADASRSLADGTATDPTQAIVAVERAQLSMQLAAQLRTKGTEALQEIFRTQV